MKKIYLLQVTLSNFKYFILYVEMEVIYIKPSQNILVVENYSFQKTIVILKLTKFFLETIVFHQKL